MKSAAPRASRGTGREGGPSPRRASPSVPAGPRRGGWLWFFLPVPLHREGGFPRRGPVSFPALAAVQLGLPRGEARVGRDGTGSHPCPAKSPTRPRVAAAPGGSAGRPLGNNKSVLKNTTTLLPQTNKTLSKLNKKTQPPPTKPKREITPTPPRDARTRVLFLPRAGRVWRSRFFLSQP